MEAIVPISQWLSGTIAWSGSCYLKFPYAANVYQGRALDPDPAVGPYAYVPAQVNHLWIGHNVYISPLASSDSAGLSPDWELDQYGTLIAGLPSRHRGRIFLMAIPAPRLPMPAESTAAAAAREAAGDRAEKGAAATTTTHANGAAHPDGDLSAHGDLVANGCAHGDGSPAGGLCAAQLCADCDWRRHIAARGVAAPAAATGHVVPGCHPGCASAHPPEAVAKEAMMDALDTGEATTLADLAALPMLDDVSFDMLDNLPDGMLDALSVDQPGAGTAATEAADDLADGVTDRDTMDMPTVD